MTIANTKASNVFNANGVTRDFNLGFVYDENVSGISIKVIDTEGTETEVSSNYTIYNGVLTYPTVDSGLDPLAEGYKITIERLTPHTQTIDLIQQGPLDAETLEGGYDKLTMEVQELQDASDRSIKFPVQVEGETDAQAYIDELTALKDTATAAATTATSEAGIATAAATAAATSESNAEKWAEGTDAQVAALGGTHSAEGWAGIAQTAAESENVQTVIDNMSDINTVAGISADVTEVASISTAVSNVATHDDDVLLVSDNMASVLTTASNITSVNTVAAAASKVVTVGENISDVGTVADNVADVSTVATDITKVNTVATDIETIKAVNENKTNIDAVAGNAANITAVSANSTNITTVANDKTNIDTVAGNTTNINTVATNTADINTVAADITKITSVADNLTNIDAVADNETNINTVASDINRVNLVADDIASVHTVAVDISNIIDVADNKTNIDAVAGNATNINTVAADSTSINAVAADLTNIDEVADDLENIDIVADSVPYKWQKPADWVDIRSFAPANSIVLLVGHKADYSKYPSFSMKAEVSNSGTYDVFVDGIKQATTASGTATTLTWQTLALTSGYDVTYPEALRTHIVRITPTLSTNTLTKLEGNYSNQGTLWAHITALNAIRYNYTFKNNAVLDVVTSASDEILVNFFEGAFQDCASLKQVPAINCTTTGNYYCTNAFTSSGIKKVTIKNAQIAYGTDAFRVCPNLEEIELINSKIQFQDRIFENCPKLKKFPPFWLANNHLFDFRAQAIAGYSAMTSALQDTVVDFSSDAGYLNKLVVNGYFNGARVDGIKGVMVSPNSPLASGTSPQIDVQYTGLDRAALINLFKSMPYNVGYTVVGSPTITSGVVSDFSSSNYLTLPAIFSGKSEIETVFAFKFDSIGTSYVPLLQTNGYGMIFCITPERKIGAYLSFDGTSWGATISNFVGSTTIDLNSSYSAMLKKTATTYELWLKSSGGSWNLEATLNNSDTLVSGTIRIGYGSRAFPGSIDLNNTYININGVPWFTGKAAMTKTCNISGTTGVSDLTADDKAIATDKGWSLTLS